MLMLNLNNVNYLLLSSYMTLRKFLLSFLKYIIRAKKELKLLNKVMHVMMSAMSYHKSLTDVIVAIILNLSTVLDTLPCLV